MEIAAAKHTRENEDFMNQISVEKMIKGKEKAQYIH